jgi:hypothetical protein
MQLPATHRVGTSSATVTTYSGRLSIYIDTVGTWRDSAVMSFSDGTTLNLSKIGSVYIISNGSNLMLLRRSPSFGLPSVAEMTWQSDGSLQWIDSDNHVTEVFRK